MDDENVLATEEAPDPTAEYTSSPDETEASSPGDGAVTEEEYEIPETMADIPSEEFILEVGSDSTSETVSVITVEAIQAVGSDIAHANLFGSFLICGTLIGLALLRKVYGT